MCIKDKPWFDNPCRDVFGLKQVADKLWTRYRSLVNFEEFVSWQVRANETYSEAKRQFSDRTRDVLMNVHSPQKRRFTLKSAVFSSRRHCLLSYSEGGGLLYESVGKG